MNAASTERQAYFASLSTPDLIVCATVERASFSAEDLESISAELRTRGIDPERLAVPANAAAPLGRMTPRDFAGPLTSVGQWWTESWRLFTAEFGFVALVTLVVFLPRWVLDGTLGSMHRWDFSFGTIAHLFVVLAFDALFAAAIIRGLYRRMKDGHCSVGRAVALGMERWGWVFRNTLKFAALALGLPVFFFMLNQNPGMEGIVSLGIILLIYPGIYVLIRYAWVQPLASLEPGLVTPLVESKRMSQGRYKKILGFFLVFMLAGWGTFIATLIVQAILPGRMLESLASGYIFAMLVAFMKVALLVGYFHVRSQPLTGSSSQGEFDGSRIPDPPSL